MSMYDRVVLIGTVLSVVFCIANTISIIRVMRKG